MTKTPQYDKQATIVLATRNKGKIRELSVLLEPFHVQVLGLDAFPSVGDVEESGTTFEANALLKACTVSRLTGLVAVADDSGLEVDALEGAPGVYSARYSDAPGLPATDARNTEKLLAAIADVPAAERTARFRCCMAACTPGGEHLTALGAWEGSVAAEPLGENGFGYDPVFWDPQANSTAAQLSPEIKNSRSHRAKAVSQLMRKWPSFWDSWVNSIN